MSFASPAGITGMDIVTSKDGTAIAFERTGAGPPLILVDGALCYRGSGPSRALAKQLAPRFTVYTYDRRGRGESGDGAPYAVEREVEDIEALIGQAGGSAHLAGISSGALLALDAADNGLPVTELALYEPATTRP
jgi:pimeloyl-ACP methyl ester carboxylesterase